MAVDYTKPPTIQIYNRDFQLTTEINGEVYSYFKFCRNYRSHGNFCLYINKNSIKAQYLLDADAFMIVYHDGKTVRAGIIETVECNLSSSGAGGEELIVSGRVGGYMTNRLAVANTAVGTGYDVQTGTAETVARHYVDVNCIHAVDASGASAPTRALPNLALADNDYHRGDLIAYSARYESIADILEIICNASGIGWEITFDRVSRQFIFNVLLGTDHSEVTRQPVIFKPELQTISSLEYLDDIMNSKTFVYVGGSGEGATRTIQPVHISGEEPSGYSRREVFIDSSNNSGAAELITQGRSELGTKSESVSISATINSASNRFEYQTDYNLGDFVTVDYTGVAKIDVRIIGIIDEVVAGARGNVRNISAVLGTEPADIRRIVKQTSKKTLEARK